MELDWAPRVNGAVFLTDGSPLSAPFEFCDDFNPPASNGNLQAIAKEWPVELAQLCSILEQLEPGMSITIPKDWFSLNVEGADETARDVKTIELVLGYNCTWARNPEADDLTFTKQPPNRDGEERRE